MAGETSSAFDPRVPLLLLLSATTGLVDAASVLGLGKVFTANMTGNIVFLGFAVAGTPGFAWQVFVVSILSFLVGAAVGGRAGKSHVGSSERRWLVTAAAIETTLLLAAALLAGAFGAAQESPQLLGIVILTAIAMGFRNATVRQLKVADLTTTVLTLTLTGLAADSLVARGGNPNWARRIGAVAAIFVGAAAGAWLLLSFGLAIPLALAGLLVLFSTLVWAAHPASARLVAA